MFLSVQRIVRDFIVVGPDQIGIKSEIRECKNSARDRRSFSIDTALPEAQNFGHLFKEQSQKTLKSNSRKF
jgi:hypothetical protein